MKRIDIPIVITPTLTLPPQETVSQFVMPAKAGIQDFKYLNKIKNWIPASAGMTALFSNYDTVSQRGMGNPGSPTEN
jgi:hypothetical protein